jgi:hypothetical protein
VAGGMGVQAPIAAASTICHERRVQGARIEHDANRSRSAPMLLHDLDGVADDRCASRRIASSGHASASTEGRPSRAAEKAGARAIVVGALASNVYLKGATDRARRSRLRCLTTPQTHLLEYRRPV